MTLEETDTTLGKNTKVTIALAAAVCALGIGAMTSYSNFKEAVREEIRDGNLEAVVELTKLNVRVENVDASVQTLSSEMRRSVEILEQRSDSRYKALEERVRALETNR